MQRRSTASLPCTAQAWEHAVAEAEECVSRVFGRASESGVGNGASGRVETDGCAWEKVPTWGWGLREERQEEEEKGGNKDTTGAKQREWPNPTVCGASAVHRRSLDSICYESQN
ncbi:hypothetical protein FIBSPDRAFT_893092 [Athelia psychrophila]|uniref:Uncharacterized protein n=1 Tax=Athelia psychrophila TaxID=1759441 RepID=A0A166HHZ5_9AGAM|nr:hypothetical protein FIBSPDRAFT_893092 [Fibularhizoctonia sp. CBS 109695]